MTQFTLLAEVASITLGVSMSGRGAGAREGDWQVNIVRVGDIQDDRLLLEQTKSVVLEQTATTERYLVRPNDLLLTARSSLFKAALVPPSVERAVADASLHIVRVHPDRPPGLAQFLWWYVTAEPVRGELQAMMSGTTVLALPPHLLRELPVPVPDGLTLDRVANLVDVSEQAYSAAIAAAHLRRTIFRDAIVADLRREAERCDE